MGMSLLDSYSPEPPPRPRIAEFKDYPDFAWVYPCEQFPEGARLARGGEFEAWKDAAYAAIADADLAWRADRRADRAAQYS